MPHDGIPVNTRRGLGPGLRETRKDIPATQLFITMRGKKAPAGYAVNSANGWLALADRRPFFLLSF